VRRSWNGFRRKTVRQRIDSTNRGGGWRRAPGEPNSPLAFLHSAQSGLLSHIQSTERRDLLHDSYELSREFWHVGCVIGPVERIGTPYRPRSCRIVQPVSSFAPLTNVFSRSEKRQWPSLCERTSSRGARSDNGHRSAKVRLLAEREATMTIAAHDRDRARVAWRLTGSHSKNDLSLGRIRETEPRCKTLLNRRSRR
jgi:hypothetical protein